MRPDQTIDTGTGETKQLVVRRSLTAKVKQKLNTGTKAGKVKHRRGTESAKWSKRRQGNAVTFPNQVAIVLAVLVGIESCSVEVINYVISARSMPRQKAMALIGHSHTRKSTKVDMPVEVKRTTHTKSGKLTFK